VTINAYARKKNAVGYGEDVGGRPRALDESGSKEVGRSHPYPLGNCSGAGEDWGGQSVEENSVLGSWSAREEARKSWDHILCNEYVYFAKPLDVNGKVSHIFAEKYVRNDLWFHIRWTQLNTRQAGDYYVEALLEFVHVDEASSARGELDGRVATVNGDGAMLVEVPKFVELPEGFGLYGVRSVVRLKRIKNRVNAGIKQRAFLPVTLIRPTNREGNSGRGFFIDRNRFRKQVDQVPCELVKGSAEAVDEVSHGESDLFRGGVWSNCESVLRQIKIVLFSDRIRIAVNPVAQSLFSRLEVKVSPSGFHVHILN